MSDWAPKWSLQVANMEILESYENLKKKYKELNEEIVTYLDDKPLASVNSMSSELNLNEDARKQEEDKKEAQKNGQKEAAYSQHNLVRLVRKI